MSLSRGGEEWKCKGQGLGAPLKPIRVVVMVLEADRSVWWFFLQLCLPSCIRCGINRGVGLQELKC